MRYKLIHIYKLNVSYYVVFNIGIINRNTINNREMVNKTNRNIELF